MQGLTDILNILSKHLIFKFLDIECYWQSVHLNVKFRFVGHILEARFMLFFHPLQMIKRSVVIFSLFLVNELELKILLSLLGPSGDHSFLFHIRVRRSKLFHMYNIYFDVEARLDFCVRLI